MRILRSGTIYYGHPDVVTVNSLLMYCLSINNKEKTRVQRLHVYGFYIGLVITFINDSYAYYDER